MKYSHLFVAFIAISLAFSACSSSSGGDDVPPQNAAPTTTDKVAKSWLGDTLQIDSNPAYSFYGTAKLSNATLTCTTGKNFTVKLSSNGTTQTGTWSLSSNDTKITFTAGMQNAVNQFFTQNIASFTPALFLLGGRTIKSFSANDTYDIMSITDNKMKLKGTAATVMTTSIQGTNVDFDFTSTIYLVVKL